MSDAAKLDLTKIIGALLFIVLSLGVYVFNTSQNTATAERARLRVLIEKSSARQVEIEKQIVRVRTVVERAHR